MRIIDADELLKGRTDHEMISTHLIYNAPTVDVLDKIREEIADLDDADYDYEGYYKAVTDALKIIDKYR